MTRNKDGDGGGGVASSSIYSTAFFFIQPNFFLGPKTRGNSNVYSERYPLFLTPEHEDRPIRYVLSLQFECSEHFLCMSFD